MNERQDVIVPYLTKIVTWCVKVLAILITLVIMWGVVDICFLLITNAYLSNLGAFNIENLLSTMSNFLAVLIAIEIFMNIVIYLKKDSFHVPLVLATAVTAIARKIIVIDFSITPAIYIFAAAAAILAIGAAFWLVSKSQDN